MGTEKISILGQENCLFILSGRITETNPVVQCEDVKLVKYKILQYLQEKGVNLKGFRETVGIIPPINKY